MSKSRWNHAGKRAARAIDDAAGEMDRADPDALRRVVGVVHQPRRESWLGGRQLGGRLERGLHFGGGGVALLASPVQNALRALPEDFRAAVVLCDVVGLSYQEIGRSLGVPVGTVRSRIHRGRALLRKALAVT